MICFAKTSHAQVAAIRKMKVKRPKWFFMGAYLASDAPPDAKTSSMYALWTTISARPS